MYRALRGNLRLRSVIQTRVGKPKSDAANEQAQRRQCANVKFINFVVFITFYKFYATDMMDDVKNPDERETLKKCIAMLERMN